MGSNTVDSSTARENQALCLLLEVQGGSAVTDLTPSLNTVNAVMDLSEVRRSLECDRGHELALIMART